MDSARDMPVAGATTRGVPVPGATAQDMPVPGATARDEDVRGEAARLRVRLAAAHERLAALADLDLAAGANPASPQPRRSGAAAPDISPAAAPERRGCVEGRGGTAFFDDDDNATTELRQLLSPASSRVARLLELAGTLADGKLADPALADPAQAGSALADPAQAGGATTDSAVAEAARAIADEQPHRRPR